ncbi:hypothetical protein ASPZODRAFT_142496 [Penicilliopsis zonata CBS 506.65]|uniref:HNH nuclease domain-containing protein n=1 Tax=Penicilliopsis zonata CBS 506.65 TaxID=1073090 RepID=A0A1L9SHT4_9EURO|nr:hypothetical protein ASPZODRAFT_142496 [Penicilliopsis zonata CBS 506.65]OJJ46697.1 hypothetical protein ASPZODRAFT_142496 [Penicilliopsis zonata CBS 506.65]
MWAQTEEARQLFEQLRAQQCRVTSFRKQAEAPKPERRSLGASFINLFISSPMGLGIRTGMEPRDSRFQSQFRMKLLEDYEVVKNGKIWCPIMQDWFPPSTMTAAHLFSYKHGQASMDAIFGQIRPAELFSSRNGLMICSAVEEYFDAGVITIVPDLPERPTMAMLSYWLGQETRDFKIRVIDSSWSCLDMKIIQESSPTKWRDLDNRRLYFRGRYHPAARYLYFHYCLQVLRRAWRVGPGQRAAFELYDELGKPLWGTPGRYMARNMLRAFVEELGHEYEPLMQGGTLLDRGDSRLLLETAAAQIGLGKEEESESEEEEEDDIL